MADVFISYARHDLGRVRLIAETLHAEGLSVWWDPEILPGTTFDLAIDRELNAAACVIVVWSEASRQSRWVREEATDALEREILIPVLIDPVALPRGFKLVITENLADWRGDREADAWQRIMLQASALTGKGDTGKTVAEQDLAQPAAPKRATRPQQAVSSSGPQTHAATRGDSASGRDLDLTVVLVALIIGGAWFFAAEEKSAYWTVAVALAGLAFILFRFADSDLSPSFKAIASRWFLPVEGKVEVSSIEAFNKMFEAVFGPKQWSWKCIWRSAVASTLSIIIVVMVVDYYFYSLYARSFLEFTSDSVILGLVFIMSNIIGDYFSLWETRILLRFAVQRPIFLIPLIVLDAFVTLTIFIIVSSIIVVLSALFFYFILHIDLGKYLVDDFHLGPYVLHGVIVVPGSIATAYITSVWLWLALIFGPIARLMVWSRKTGLTAVGRLLDAQRKPFTALGYVTAVLILVGASGLWLVKTAIA